MLLKPFASLDQARLWPIGLVGRNNLEHRHNAIGFVTAQRRHLGQDHALRRTHREVSARVRDTNPRHWSRHARHWNRICCLRQTHRVIQRHHHRLRLAKFPQASRRAND